MTGASTTGDPAPPSGPRRGVAAWAIALPALAVLAAYATSLPNGAVWDDQPLVVDNPFLKTPEGLVALFRHDLWTASATGDRSQFYRPLTMASFWLNAQLGDGPLPLRLGNLGLHALNGVLLAVGLRRVAELDRLLAAALATLWAVAPVVSEPVLWISGRFDLLMVTFALLALLASRRDAPGLAPTRAAVAVSVGCVAAGLFCKEGFLGWLPVLLLDDVVAGRRPWRSLAPKWGAIAGAVLLFLSARHAVGVMSLSVVSGTGALEIARSFAFLAWAGLSRLVVPRSLDPFRPYQPPDLAVTGVALAVLAAAGLWVGWRLVRARDARLRPVALGVGWYALATLPASVVGPNLEMVGDRYFHFPSIGVFLALAGALATLDVAARRRAAAAVAVLAVPMAWLTARHAPSWRDDETLARSSLAASPENPYALYWLGHRAVLRGELDEAERLLDRSLRGDPRSWRTWNAVCVLQLRRGRLPEAAEACERTLQGNAENARAWGNLAAVHARARRWGAALSAAERGIAVRPRYVETRYLAAVAAANLGDLARARAELEVGLDLSPRHAGLLALGRELDALTPP